MTNKPYPSDQSLAVRLNQFGLSLSKNWLIVVLIAIGLYAGLPIAAPILMRLGATDAGRALYNLYSPMCHQFAYRSFFLFGDQSAYPRENANVPNVRTYESYLDQVNADVARPTIGTTDEANLGLQSKVFLGNAQMGWKTAICQRDVAIYWALFAGGLIFLIPRVRTRLRPVSIWLYLLLGVAPIAIDGFSQLLSYPLPPLWNSGFWPIRETTPLFRVATGALFGLMNAWLAYPYLESSAREARIEIEEKFAARAARQK